MSDLGYEAQCGKMQGNAFMESNLKANRYMTDFFENELNIEKT